MKQLLTSRARRSALVQDEDAGSLPKVLLTSSTSCQAAILHAHAVGASCIFSSFEYRLALFDFRIQPPCGILAS